MLREVNIHIGQVKMAAESEVLRALLGSCVGVGLIWRRRGLCTLSHCLLPRSPGPVTDVTGRWVDAAIHSSLRLMEAETAHSRQLQAVVAGGGNMISGPVDGGVQVGTGNVAAARETLRRLRIEIIEEDVGGELGRRLELSGADLSYRIETIPRLSAHGADH